jgi:hypothetical protein
MSPLRPIQLTPGPTLKAATGTPGVDPEPSFRHGFTEHCPLDPSTKLAIRRGLRRRMPPIDFCNRNIYEHTSELPRLNIPPTTNVAGRLLMALPLARAPPAKRTQARGFVRLAPSAPTQSPCDWRWIYPDLLDSDAHLSPACAIHRLELRLTAAVRLRPLERTSAPCNPRT